MTVREQVAAQPDGVMYPKTAVLELLDRAAVAVGPEWVSPGWCARHIGWSKTQWTRWAGSEGLGHKDRQGRWRLNREKCTVLAVQQNQPKTSRRGPRGPRKTYKEHASS